MANANKENKEKKVAVENPKANKNQPGGNPKGNKNQSGKPSFGQRFKAFFVRIGNFFKSTFSELKKVTWPKPKLVGTSLAVVLVVVLVFLLVVFGMDMGLSSLLKLLVGSASAT